MGFGYFLGGALVAVAVGVFLRRRHHHFHRGYGGRRHWMLRSLFYRLQASPSQQQVLEDELLHVLDALHAAKRDWTGLRSDLASAVRGTDFDQASFDKAQAAQEASWVKVRETVKASLSRVHQILDERQRETLARLIERGPSGHHPHHRMGWV